MNYTRNYKNSNYREYRKNQMFLYRSCGSGNLFTKERLSRFFNLMLLKVKKNCDNLDKGIIKSSPYYLTFPDKTLELTKFNRSLANKEYKPTKPLKASEFLELSSLAEIIHMNINVLSDSYQQMFIIALNCLLELYLFSIENDENFLNELILSN